MNAGNQIHRVASPDDGTGTLHGGSRLRAGSLNSRIWLQVTTDNESFQTVDISGLTTSDAIRERVFSRVSWLGIPWANERSYVSAMMTTLDSQSIVQTLARHPIHLP
jgi:hypothetical protein